MARIYVSSTFTDLEDYRQKVSLAIRRLGHEDVAMEHYVAEDRRPLDLSLADVASCDVYIGIFAWRYGYVPDVGNPDRLSITELEYRCALANGKTCLIFVISEDAPWPRSKMEYAAMDRIDALRQELMNGRHVVNTFENADELAREVTEAVARWEQQTGLAGKREPASWLAYREAVSSRHQWVRLQVIAGASKERDPIRIPLTEVFEPQLVAPGASGTDIPDEVRRYQQEIYGIRLSPSALDAEVTDEEIAEDGGPATVPEEQLLSGNPEQVLDILGRERTQVILGGPGSGKSTLLQYVILRVSELNGEPGSAPPHLQNDPVPFLVELRSYVLQKDSDFASHIVNKANDFYAAAIDADALNRILEKDDGAIVFFDGLDEIFDPDERRQVIDQFQAFSRRYRRARIVVTSRIAGYDPTSLGLAGFKHYTLMPLTLGHIRNFAERWYRYYTLEGTERTAQGLVQRIVESPRLLDLAGNPLLLTMMAVIYKDRDLPVERWRLYERCAETLLEDWDLRRGIRDSRLVVAIRTAQKSEMLQQVSMYMLEHSQAGSELNAIAYAPLMGIVASYLEVQYQRPRGEAKDIAVDILRHLMERTYVLAGIGERVFGFVHRTFMEYFAAYRCLTQFNARKSDFGWLTRDIFEAHWQEPEWEEVLLLLIAMLHDQGTPIRDVVEHLRLARSTDLPFNVAFAARCLGEAGDVQDQLQGQQLLAELADAIAEYAAQPRRKDAAGFVETALGAFAALAPAVTAPADVIAVIEHLNQADTVSTRTAAWQMGFALRSRQERLDYAVHALHDPEETVRRGAIAALEREWPGRANIGDALAGVVRTDRQSRVRLAALATIQRSWRHQPAILDAIESRADEETAYTVVIQLIEYLAAAWPGNPRALHLVERLAAPKPRMGGSYDYTSVLSAATRAIATGWPDDAAGLAFLQERVVVSSDPELRATLFQAIAASWAGHRRMLAFLQEQAAAASVPSVRAAALRAIAQGWAGDAEGLAFLQEQAAAASVPSVRAAALQAIAQGWAGDAEGFAFLRERAADDAEPATRAAALRAIAQGWAGDAEGFAFVRERAVADAEPATRTAAFRAAMYWLPRWGRKVNRDQLENVLEFFASGFRDTDAAVREGAIISSIIFLEDSSGEFRAGLVPDAITRTNSFLEERAVSDPDMWLRVISLNVLARSVGKFSSFPNIDSDNVHRFVGENLDFLREQAVDNPQKRIRSVSLWAVADGSVDISESLAFLQGRAADDPDPETRSHALRAIGWAWGGNYEAKEYLQIRSWDDPAESTRSVASEVLLGIVRGQRWRYFPHVELVDMGINAVWTSPVQSPQR